MKKILSSALASFILVSFVLASCSQVLSDGEKATSYDSARFGKYSEVGASIKAGFEKQFGEATRAARESEDSDVTTEDYYIEYLDDEKSSDYLFKNGYVSETAKSYIERIENLFDAEDESSVESSITAIENEVMENLSGNDLDNVMYYAEATKASISYWREVENSGARWGVRKFLKKYKHVVVSAALGAVTGAVYGFIKTGTVSGTVTQAVKTAISSGSAAYASGKITVSYKYQS